MDELIQKIQSKDEKNLISAEELCKLNPQVIPKYAQGFLTENFWYYTRLSTADMILDGKSFWVSSINDMNDLDEKERHEKDKNRIYALCFCNSKHEKIPMWYLYSGITGKGVSLGLTPRCMLDFLQSLETVYGVVEDNKPGVKLTIGSDVELQFGWVYYQDQQDTKRILHKSKWHTVDDIDKFEHENYFIKNYPWEYEKEFRLVFVNKTDTTYKRLIVPIPEELRNKMRLRLAPELDPDNYGNTELAFIGKNSTITPTPSALKIRMNLLRRNKMSLPEYLPEYLNEELTRKDPDIKPEMLCKLIQDTCHCAKVKTNTETDLNCHKTK